MFDAEPEDQSRWVETEFSHWNLELQSSTKNKAVSVDCVSDLVLVETKFSKWNRLRKLLLE